MSTPKQAWERSSRAKAARAGSRPFFEALEERQYLSLPATWTSMGAGGGGAFFDPIFNPTNTSEVYCSSDMTGEYHSTDSGATWSILNFQKVQGNHKEGGLQFTSSGVMYAMDANAFPVKSTDGGVTWTSVNNPGGNLIGLLADYNNPNHIVISSYSSIYFSANGGVNWSQIYTNANGAMLAGAFFDGNNIYVAVSTGVMTSTNGGTSFSTPSANGINTSTQGIYSFAGAKSGNTTRFFCVTVAAGDCYPGNEGDACYDFQSVYTMDAGQSGWTAKTSGIPSTARPCYVSMLLNDINTVYLAGGSTVGAPTVLKSTNAGSNWTSVFNTTNNQNIQTGWQGYGGDRDWSYGEYADGFAVAAFDSTKLMLTDMGAAYLSNDGGTTWHAAYVNQSSLNAANQNTPDGKAYHGNGMEDTTVWDLTWADASTMFASFTDIRGIRSTDGGNTWSFHYNGDYVGNMYRSVVQPGTGYLYAAVSNTHDIYQWESYQDDSRIDSSTSGQVLMSTDKGADWSLVHDFGKPVVWATIAPNNANRMYVSVANHAGSGTAGGIYVSSNINLGSSSTWTKLANPPRTEGHPFNIVVLNDGTIVATYAGRLDSNWNYTQSSGVFVSTDGGNTWSDRSTAQMEYHTRDITIDPADSSQNTWYAAAWTTTSNVYMGPGQIFKTTNRGQTWTALLNSTTANAMDRIEQVAINPNNPNEGYVTSADKGLWYTSNLQSGSPTFSQVTSYGFYAPTRVFFDPYDSNQVWVTSFGYGLAKGVMQAGTATKLTFGQQPTSTPVNGAITPAVTVAVQDANGNTVTSNNSNVTIAINSGTGTLSGTLTVAAINGIATFSNLSIDTPGNFTLKATDSALSGYSDAFTVYPSVQARHIFYNDSYYDGYNSAANASDDSAIATDKSALLPGGTATFANYTSYSKGINGIMVDVAGLAGVPTTSDFTFKVGNSDAPSSWSSAPRPSISVRSGAGANGSSRVTLVWSDGAIQDKWLQVTVKATAVTGLQADDVFYFGNAIGESGNSTVSARVDAGDVAGARQDPHKTFANPAGITNPHDYNRDHEVTAADEVITRMNMTTILTDLKLIAPPVTLGAEAPASTDEPVFAAMAQQAQSALQIPVLDSVTIPVVALAAVAGAPVAIDESPVQAAEAMQAGPQAVVPVSISDSTDGNPSLDGPLISPLPTAISVEELQEL